MRPLSKFDLSHPVTVRHLLGLLTTLMEENADTPILVDNPETGLSPLYSVCVCDTEDKYKEGEVFSPVSVIIDFYPRSIQPPAKEKGSP